MEGGLNVTQFLGGKTVFVTGSTGFVGKVIVEKLLRSFDCGRIYVLVRPQKGSTATERMQKEIISSEIFTRLRNELGSAENFNALVNQKLFAIGGELTRSKIGLSVEDEATLLNEVNIIIHSAAVVDFNERLDRAIELNIRGKMPYHIVLCLRLSWGLFSCLP